MCGSSASVDFDCVFHGSSCPGHFVEALALTWPVSENCVFIDVCQCKLQGKCKLDGYEYADGDAKSAFAVHVRRDAGSDMKASVAEIGRGS